MKFRTFVIIALMFAGCGAGFPGAADAQSTTYHWDTIPFGGGGYVPAYLYHPKAKNLLYARTDVGGLYRFDYANKTWIQLFNAFNHDDGELSGILSVALDPNDPSKVFSANGMYVGQWSHKGAIMRSSDQGKTWQRTDLPIGVGGNADGRGSGERLVVDPKDSHVLFYGSNQDGLWKSTDSAASFGKISSPVTSFSLVAIDPNSDAVYLGSADGPGALYVSHNHGMTFIRVPETPEEVPQHMAFGKDGSVYVTFSKSSSNYAVNPGNASRGAVWKRDAAGHWADITPEQHQEQYFGYSGIDIGPDGTLVVSALDRWDGGNSVFLSRDGGARWIGLKGQTEHNFGVYPWYKSWAGDPENMGGWLSDVKINPFNANEMISTGTWFTRNLSEAGTGKRVLFDLDTAGLEESVVMQMWSPQYGKIKVLAAMGDNGGAAWYDITKSPDVGIFRPTKSTDRSVDFAALRPSFMAVTADNAPPTQGLYSEDGARTWTLFPSSPCEPAPAGQWRSPGELAVSAGGTSIVWVPEKQGAYYSRDKGKTWKESTGWPTRRDRQLSVVSDKTYDGAFYAYDQGETIYMSVDDGVSFQPIITGLKKLEAWQAANLYVVPGRVRDLWLITPNGLLHSPNDKTPMTNFPHVKAAWSLGFGAPMVKEGYPSVYLWGRVDKEEGLWRSDDEGQSWMRINDDQHMYGGLLAGDWHEPGVVYVGQGAHGVLVGRPSK